MALGLQAPWSVTDVRFDIKAKEIHFEVRFKPGSRFACPSCGAADQPVHDTRPRTWEHLRFFEHKAFIHASVPRTACSACGKTGQVPVPWARSGSGFSQLFDAFVIALAREMPVKTIADLLEVGDDRIWRVLDHYVPAARELEDFSDVTAVGIDETAARRGHNYITLFHDLEAGRLLFACEGRDAGTVKTFAEDLRAHGGDPDAITAACIDMSRAYIAGVGRHLPNAAITFDRFHVIQLANAALEEVRRAEVRVESALKHSRWMWLKDKHSWTKRQIAQHHDLSRMHLMNFVPKQLTCRARKIGGCQNCQSDDLTASLLLTTSKAPHSDTLQEKIQVRTRHIITHSRTPDAERHLMRDVIEHHGIYVIRRCQDWTTSCIEKCVVLGMIIGISQKYVCDRDLEEGKPRYPRKLGQIKKAPDDLG